MGRFGGANWCPFMLEVKVICESPTPKTSIVAAYLYSPLWHNIPKTGPWSLNPIAWPRGPSEQVGDLFKCTCFFCCIPYACGNKQTYCTIYKIHCGDFSQGLGLIGGAINPIRGIKQKLMSTIPRGLRTLPVGCPGRCCNKRGHPVEFDRAGS